VKKLKHSAALFLLLWFLVSPTESWAWSSSGGLGEGDDSGCCIVPKELEADASALEKQFLLVDQKTLRLQRFAKSLCSNHNCGGFDEEQASQLLDDLIQEHERNNGWWFNFAAAFSGIAGVVFGALGLILAWLAHKQSTAAERQSARNEVEISHLKDRRIGG
jgi:hypothetical protein